MTPLIHQAMQRLFALVLAPRSYSMVRWPFLLM